MEMVVNHKINLYDVEGEDYDCAALESSLSSLLGFLDPSSRESPSKMDLGKTHTVDSVTGTNREAEVEQSPQAAEADAQAPAGEAGSPSEIARRRNNNSSGGASSASCGENADIGRVSRNMGKEDQGAAAQPRELSSLMQHQHETPLQELSEDGLVVAKRASSSSCSSDGAGSNNAANVATDLGLKVADVCRATVRDMLKEVLLETLPLQNAVEVLFKMDSHSAWNDIRTCATAIIASSSAIGGGAIAAAGLSALPPMYRGSASLPSTPAKSSPDSFTAAAGGVHLALAPPLLPPLTAPPMQLRDAAAGSARGPATSPGGPPSPPPPFHGPVSSSLLPAESTLAPLTPARSAPGAIPGPTFGTGGISSPTRAEAAGRGSAGSGECTPLGSGPSGIAPTPAAAAAAPDASGAGPSSASPPLLTSLLQQHPNLMDCLQHHPQLLSSILSMAGGGSGTSTGGAVPAEGMCTAAACAATVTAVTTPAFDEVHAGGGAGGYAAMMAGLHHHPQLGSPLTSGMRSPPSLSSPAAHGPGIWASPIQSRGSPMSAGPFGSPQPHAGAQSGLETFHVLMGGGGGASGGGGVALQGTDPNAAGYSCKTFEELSPAVRDKIQSVLDSCGPHIRAEHFDAGVRHWLLQLQMLFGEMCAVSALHAIETAANLEGVRRMKAFITTRLIDHYEQMVWAQDPQGYAMRKLTPDLIAVLEELVQGDKGLRWTHFDPKVLDTIREIRTPDAVRTRLSKLCAQELNGVQNVPAYLYTLLSKRGKTAKQAAAQKQMQELALRLAAAQGVSMGMGFGGASMGGVAALGGIGGGLGALGGLAAMGLAGHSGAPYGAAAGAPAPPYGGMYGAGGAGTASTSAPYGAGAGGLGSLAGYTNMFGL